MRQPVPPTSRAIPVGRIDSIIRKVVRPRYALVCSLLWFAIAGFAQTASAQSFKTTTSYPVGDNPLRGAVGDFNGDGKLDLAVGNVLSKSVSVLLNNGDGTFQSAVFYVVDFNPVAVSTADFNSDGKLDLAVGNSFGGPFSTGSISILLGIGNGTFAAPVGYTAVNPNDISVADLNADGKLDLAAPITNGNAVSILLGNGNGTFQSAITYGAGIQPASVVVADWNGDGKPDLALTNLNDDKVSVLLGNGDGTFQSAVELAAGRNPRGIAASDLNGDNKQDFIIAPFGAGAVQVFLGNGNGTFAAPVNYPVQSGPDDLALGDLNGDGKTDIVTVNTHVFSVSVLRGNGDGTFQTAINKPARVNSYIPILGDFDSDGKPDLAITNNGFDLVDVWLNSPSAHGSGFSATRGSPATGVLVATFVDYDAAKTASSFTASINWGDGSSSTSGTISSNGSGGFNVTGTHTYAAAGSYSVTVQIADTSGNYANAAGTATVTKTATSTAVTSSVNPSEFGQSVTFTATVTSNASTPGGTVQFKDGGVNLGSAQTLNGSGVAQLTTSSLTSGTHTITAEYSGDANFVNSSATLSGGQVIKDQPTLSINDVSIGEGNSGTTNLIFTVTLSAASTLTVNVNYATANGTATVADSDYQTNSNTLTFNPGDLSQTVTILVNGDQKFEADETLFVNLTTPVDAAISDNQGLGTILNDDTLQLILDESGPDANQAAAFDSLLFVRDPFHVQSIANWLDLGSDRNTRVLIFATNLQLNPGETAAAVVINLVDSNGQIYNLEAEDVRAVPNTSFTQVRFRLPDNLAAGTCLVTIKAHNQTSNTGSFRIVN